MASDFDCLLPPNSVITKSLVLGLFKNAQMQGAQEPYREAYMDIR
jgi:hypothetical protein